MNATPVSPPKKFWKTKGFLITAGVMLSGYLTIALVVGFRSQGFLRTSNVGDLPELASIQAQLLPLAACEIKYGPRGDRHRYGSSDSVVVTPCSKGWGFVSSVSVPVPEARRVDKVTFDMTRRSMSDPWKILVEKDKVAFPALKSSLEQLAPVLVEQYPAEYHRERERQEGWAREAKARKDAERARKDEAKTSYPE